MLSEMFLHQGMISNAGVMANTALGTGFSIGTDSLMPDLSNDKNVAVTHAGLQQMPVHTAYIRPPRSLPPASSQFLKPQILQPEAFPVFIASDTKPLATQQLDLMFTGFLTQPVVTQLREVLLNFHSLTAAQIAEKLKGVSIDSIAAAAEPYLTAVKNYGDSFAGTGSPAVHALVNSAEALVGRLGSGLSQVESRHLVYATALVAALFLPMSAFAGEGAEQSSVQLALNTLFEVGGGLSLFFMGMQLMSRGLRDAAGTQLRKIMAKAAGDRFRGYATGFGVTAFWQSSSITTSINVGLVDAGIISRFQALSINLGANLGTCVTGLLLTLDIAKYGEWFLALGLPYFFAKDGSLLKNMAKSSAGLGSLFLGMEIMKHALKTPDVMAVIHNIFSTMDAHTLPGVASCIGVATLATMTIQSSSATMGIVLALASTGVLDFQTAAAMVFGLNIGTTITAILAAMTPGTSRDALRSAVGHTFFNTALASIIFWFAPQYIALLEDIYKHFGWTGVEDQIVASHWTFNAVEALVFLPILGKVDRLLEWMVPSKKTDAVQLTHLKKTLLEVPDVAVQAVQKAIIGMSDDVKEMKKHVDALMRQLHDDQAEANLILDEVEPAVLRLEHIVDRKQNEILPFLDLIPPHHPVHGFGIVTEQLETLGDYFNDLLSKIKGLRDWKQRIEDKELRADINRLYSLVSDSITTVFDEIALAYANGGLSETPEAFFEKAMERDAAIKEAIRVFSQKYQSDTKGPFGKVSGHIRPFVTALTDPTTGLFHSMRGVTKNIAEALSGRK